MAKSKVAINGFGRIGRLVLRSFFARGDHEFEVVAVNDLTPPDVLAYLLKYDSVFRRFDGTVELSGDNLVVNGHNIKATAEAEPAKLPWKELGVDIVIESTGRFTDGAKARAHIEAGAKKVLISAPATNQDVTIVMGVNEKSYDGARHNIISNASCTTNCLAPVVKVLHERFGIVKGLMNTVHSYTNDQVTLDFPPRKGLGAITRGRAAALSIIPTSTGAAKAIAEVIPDLKGKLNGFALRVPTPDVSVVDLTAELAKPATKDEINAAVKEYAEGPLKGILAYEPDDLVSMDFVGDFHSSIFAPKHTTVIDNMIKILSWYDNEWGYSTRVVDMIDLIVKKGL
ncbi:MAG: type I glyceraldehyde-3-phosphate dehydrogenase [Synergistaceae bacterium]|jgi:glyceraldehyde 3-phosphate dehydrogenase|nr:type I glyceraldehyde-3-phosphate dehydrogenase [Synergistaceae bacterium]